jgi:hypothetical protein
LEFSLLLLYQSIQLVQQFSISFTDRIDYTGQHRTHSVCAVPKESVNYIRLDTLVEIISIYESCV